MKIKNERRKYRRLPLEFPVEITYPRKIKKARTKDVSIKGICLITSQGIKENTILRLNISLDTEQGVMVIPIKGKVVWKMKKGSKEYHQGILITEIKPDKYEEFRRFLATKLIDYILG